jgi:hypothetical protein
MEKCREKFRAVKSFGKGILFNRVYPRLSVSNFVFLYLDSIGVGKESTGLSIPVDRPVRRLVQ